jgi:hypothetical protein
MVIILNIMKKTMLLFCFTFLIGCESFVPRYAFFNIKNNSSDLISIYVKYPVLDTLLPKVRPYIIMINSNYQHNLGRVTNKDSKVGEVIIYFFKTEDINKYSWDYIINNNLFIKKIETSTSEIFKNKNTVSYP